MAQLMTPATYVSVEGGTFHSACFLEYENAAPATAGVVDIVTCGTNGVGGVAKACSGFTRQDAVGQACRDMCARTTNNTKLCATAATAYCNAHGDNPDCACLTPQTDTKWGTGSNQSTYGQLTSALLANNTNLSHLGAKCFWPPCSKTKATQVLQDPALTAAAICPNDAKIHCIVSDVTVSLRDVRANGLSIVTQQCGKGGVQGNTSPSGNLFQAAAQWTLAQKLEYGAAAVGVLLIVAGGLFLYFTVRREARMEDKAVSAATQRSLRARRRTKR